MVKRNHNRNNGNDNDDCKIFTLFLRTVVSLQNLLSRQTGLCKRLFYTCRVAISKLKVRARQTGTVNQMNCRWPAGKSHAPMYTPECTVQHNGQLGSPVGRSHPHTTHENQYKIQQFNSRRSTNDKWYMMWFNECSKADRSQRSL